MRVLGCLVTLLFLGSRAGAGDGLADRYREAAGRLLGAALADTGAQDKLEHLCLVIGPRLSGSSELERAIAWAAETMRAEGLDVRTQEVLVPHWVRGEESLQLLAPAPRALALLGLGGSVGTPPEGLSASAVVVRGFDELEALGRAGVEGKIVVYAVDWEGYGRTVAYRTHGAARAARLGAVAALVRSATGRSLYTPHTGALRYAADAPRIPAAAITVEDALDLLAAARRGEEIRLRLTMGAQTLPDAPSANVIAEIRGSERPDEVVVMGGHYDSWDVGHGAHDDGASCIAAWHALTLVHRLGLVPRRTLRVVLWTNEENGLRGGQAYRAALGDDVRSHVAAIEMDGGCERPVGFGFTLPGSPEEGEGSAAYARARGMLGEIAGLCAGIEATEIRRGGEGADIGPLMEEGVPGLSLVTVGERYFDWHHTRADTLDKVDPLDLRRATALLAVMGFVLADMPETLRGS